MAIEEILSALILAIVQGATEWFPVSSSGHLVLFENILGFEGGLLFVVALHFGTLMAVFVYFGRDITEIVREFFMGNWKSEHGRMGWLLLIGSVPAAFLGFIVRNIFDKSFTGLWTVALGFGITGLFLFIASIDVKNRRKGIMEMRWVDAIVIGASQALAIVPGISRSGATISSGLLLGLSEKNSMKFAFILSIPVIFGANILVVGNQTLPSDLIWATLVSFVVGLVSIHLVFRYVLVDRGNLRWFGVYCLSLAIAIGAWLLF